MLRIHLKFSNDLEKNLKWLKIDEIHSLPLMRKKTVPNKLICCLNKIRVNPTKVLDKEVFPMKLIQPSFITEVLIKFYMVFGLFMVFTFLPNRLSHYTFINVN